MNITYSEYDREEHESKTQQTLNTKKKRGIQPIDNKLKPKTEGSDTDTRENPDEGHGGQINIPAEPKTRKNDDRGIDKMFPSNRV